jgi:dCMP deaminase
MNVARVVAQRSLCDRDKVGAVVVSKANRLLETGYNGPPSGYVTNDVGCSSWCTRAQMKPTKWVMTPDTNPGLDWEIDNGTTYIVQGDLKRPVVSDEQMIRYGFMPGYDLSPDYSDCPSLHAEANALMRGDRSARDGGTIYITSGVCWGCAKLIANSGLILVIIDEDGNPGSHRNSEKSYQFLESCGLTVVTG